MAGRKANLLFLIAEALSDSESDSDDELLKILLHNNTNKCKRQKIMNYVDIVGKYSDDEFRRNFRLTRNTFNVLKEKMENSQFSNSSKPHGGYSDTSIEIQLLSVLWFSGNKCVIRDVSSRFGIAESTFHKTSRNVIDFLNHIAPTVIKFPETFEEKINTSLTFQKISGFPDVLGCIDGTYISIRTPAQKIKSTYVNRHADKLFLDVFTGPPSRIHDARIYKLSFISTKLEQICMNRFHLLGDSAYPIKKWLITPYRDYGNLTNEQKNFNYKFSATRVKIENAFGLLKQRFRQLIRTDFFAVDTTSKFIISCCVLHNLCIINQDIWEALPDEATDFEEIYEAACNEIPGEAKRGGEEKRDLLCRRLY